MAGGLKNTVGSTRWAYDVASWKPTEAQWLLASSCLQPEEDKRISRFVFQRDAKSSLIGRLLMRKFVSDNSELQYDQIRFNRDEQGKPFLHANSELSFNISHQGNYAVLAGETKKIQLGVDIMKLEYSGGKSLSEFFRLMARNFSSSEWRCINRPDSERDKLANFYRHWCLKESYVKATGTGITVDLRQISFQPCTQLLLNNHITDDTALYLNDIQLNDWTFHETMLDREHCVTVAMQVGKDNAPRTPFRFLTFDDLMQGCKPLNSPNILECKNFLQKPLSPR